MVTIESDPGAQQLDTDGYLWIGMQALKAVLKLPATILFEHCLDSCFTQTQHI